MTIGIIGANGFVGSGLRNIFTSENNVVISITKDNYKAMQIENITYDVLINANGNNKRYWANQNPLEDFKISVETAYDSLLNFKYKCYCYISSIAVGNLKTVEERSEFYGYHKWMIEELVRRFADNYFIVRPCEIIDTKKEVGVLADILNDRPVYVSENSGFQFISLSKFCEIVKNLFPSNGKYSMNVGGTDSISMKELEILTGKKIKYRKNTTYRNESLCLFQANINHYGLKDSRYYVKEVIDGFKSLQSNSSCL